MKYALKETNDAKLAHKLENNQVLDFKEHMVKTILKIATLNRTVRMNMQRLREEYDEVLNATKENETKENIEEHDKFRQILEDKKGYVMEIGEERDMLIEHA